MTITILNTLKVKKKTRLNTKAGQMWLAFVFRRKEVKNRRGLNETKAETDTA